jgi:hypothetical protein
LRGSVVHGYDYNYDGGSFSDSCMRRMDGGPGVSVLNEAGGESPSASMRATSISSYARGRAGSSRSASWSTAKRRAQPTGWTSTRRAGERWSSHGSISWCASLGRSRTARSRSHSSMRASRRTSSPSASDGLGPQRCRYTIFPRHGVDAFGWHRPVGGGRGDQEALWISRLHRVERRRADLDLTDRRHQAPGAPGLKRRSAARISVS